MDPAARLRYSRQILFAPIAEAGQEKLVRSSVCVAGCGALGSFQAEALARAGTGRLVLIDRDIVDFTNLQRQWLYDERDASEERPKALAAAEKLRQANSQICIEAHVADLTPSNAEELLGDCDLIVDGTDNFETRYLINDISVKRGVPWFYGAAVGSYGITMPIVPGRGPCLRCVYPDRPEGMQPTCDSAGIIAPAVAMVASLQVAAALRYLVSGEFDPCLRTVDVWTGEWKRIGAGEPDLECIACARREFTFLEGARRSAISLCGRNAVQLHERTRRLDLPELAQRLQPIGRVRVNEFALYVSMPKYDVTFFPDGRAIVKGTTDSGVARSVYAQLIGA